MGRSLGAWRRAAGSACVLVLGAGLVRLLTLPISAQRWGLELGLGLAVALCVGVSLMLAGHGWARSEVAAILRSLLGALAAGGMIGLAAGQPSALSLVALLLFSSLGLSTPARARARTVLACTLLVDGVFAVAWLRWCGGDPLTLGVAIAFMAGLQLLTLAQAQAADDNVDHDTLRSSTHAATATRVGTAIDVLGVTRAVLETSRQSYPLATHGFVFLHDPIADRLRPVPTYLGPHGVGTIESDSLDFAMTPGEGIAGKVFAASRPLVWPTALDVHSAEADLGSLAREQLAHVRGGVARCAVGAPLIVDDEVIGVYVMSSTRRELVWGEEDVTVVCALADEAARAIERARRYERELDQAHLDSITGLANHRQLTRTLEQELARARRRSTRLGVVFCDLDRFKAVNDTYGHAAGDRVLTILAQVFHDLLRGEDSAARYGGDEFVCVLPGADHEEAAAVGLRISGSFELRVRDDAELSRAGVTISCGVAIFPDDAADADGLLQHADESMRGVKAGHRSRTADAWRAG